MLKLKTKWRTKTAKKDYLQGLIEDEKIDPSSYAMKLSFELGELIEHPKFGLGFIQDTIGKQKVSVFFEDSEKVLLQNWSA